MIMIAAVVARGPAHAVIGLGALQLVRACACAGMLWQAKGGKGSVFLYIDRIGSIVIAALQREREREKNVLPLI